MSAPSEKQTRVVRSWRDDPPSGSQRVFVWLRGRPELAALIDADSTPHEVGLGLDVVWAEQSWFCANVEQFDQALTRETADLRREVATLREALSSAMIEFRYLQSQRSSFMLLDRARWRSLGDDCKTALAAMRQG